MKKKVKFEKVKYFMLGIIASAFLFGSGVYAATTYVINGSNVEYQDNSSLGVTNVQAAIDQTYNKTNGLNNRVSNVEDKLNYQKYTLYEVQYDNMYSEKMNENDGLMLYAYDNGTIILNGLISIKSDLDVDKTFASVPNEFIPKKQHWAIIKSTNTGNSYTIRIGANGKIYPWGTTLPSGVYMIDTSY